MKKNAKIALTVISAAAIGGTIWYLKKKNEEARVDALIAPSTKVHAKTTTQAISLIKPIASPFVLQKDISLAGVLL